MWCTGTVLAVAVENGIGRAIREARGNRSQKELALAAGIGPDSWSEIETGKSEPKLSTLERIAGALGLTLAVLLLRAGAIDLDLPVEELLGADPNLSDDSRDLMRRLYERAKRFDQEEGVVAASDVPVGGTPSDDGIGGL